MGDRFITSVTIGGPLHLELLQEIIGEAVSNGFSIDWEGSSNEDSILRQCLKKIQAGVKDLEFNDHEIPNDLLEAFTDDLTKKGVPWNATVDAKFEYDGDLRWWRPGMQAWESWTATGDCDEPVAKLSVLKDWKRKRGTLASLIKKMEKAPPKLPKIKWTGPTDTTGSEKTG